MKKNKGRAKNRIKHEKFKDFNITPLDDHQRDGKKLLSPFAKLGEISKLSWTNDALNEVLWAAILRGNMDQTDYLKLFRDLIVNARENIAERKETFITHSALSVLSEELFDQLMEPILKNEDAKKLLSGLLYFECLPDKKHWLRHLNNPANPNSHSEIVMKGVAKCLDHQSQESTDIRFLKAMYVAQVQERIKFPNTEEMNKELENLCSYPDCDNQSVMNFIRNIELGIRKVNEVPAPWNNDFWKECYSKTECITQNIKKPEPPKKSEYFDQFFNTYHQLAEYFIESAENTDIDAKRDACFGIVLYSLSLGLGLACPSPQKSPNFRREF